MPTSQEHPDPVIEAQIARTLASYEGVATPRMLKTMREQLGEVLTNDPLAVSMMEQLRDHGVPDRSGDNPVEGAVVPGKAGGGTEGA